MHTAAASAYEFIGPAADEDVGEIDSVTIVALHDNILPWDGERTQPPTVTPHCADLCLPLKTLSLCWTNLVSARRPETSGVSRALTS